MISRNRRRDAPVGIRMGRLSALQRFDGNKIGIHFGHRWHVVQLVKLRIPYSCTSLRPTAA